MIEYENDYRYNYLTVTCENEKDFSLQMLLENKVTGILQPELRYMDGVCKIYYCISGKQSLTNYFVHRNVNKEFFFELLHSIGRVLSLADEFFISHGGIVFSTDLIFWDMEQQRLEYIYIPSCERTLQLRELADFIAAKIDYSDESFSDLVYQFCEDIYEDKWNLDKYLDEEERYKEAETDKKSANIYSDTESEISEPEQSLIAEEYLAEDLFQDLDKEKIKNLQRTDTKKKAKSIFSFFMRRQNAQVDRSDTLHEETASYNLEEEVHEKENFQTVFYDVSLERENKLYHIGKKNCPNIELSNLPCVVGKDDNLSDFCIPDKTISRMHVRFYEESGECWMQDLNSTNGTYHNGLRLRPNQKIRLEKEDEVGIGQVNYIYR